jgi:phytoene desaturase
MPQKHIAIIGAGPGGLTAAMILAHRGHRVSVFEKKSVVGGRNADIVMDGYHFDIGPTFLMMTFVLREMFAEAGENANDHLTIKPLDPMYKLAFRDTEFWPTTDRKKMQEQITRLFPGNERGLDLFYKTEKRRHDLMYPCLKKDYSTFSSLYCRPLLKALPHLALHRSLFGVLGDYFKQEVLRLSFTFQAKYLGMSPWECPAAFAIIPYIEHAYGIDHVEGGLSRISDAMARVALKKGAAVRCSAPVKRVLTKNGRARGIELVDGEKIDADAVIVNADFGHAMETLFDRGVIRKWAPDRLRNKKYSCSTFMLYLGLDKRYDEPHHQIVFADDYAANIADIVKYNRLSNDMSVYVRNASVTDPTIAPPGHSAAYVLVPVANAKSGISWDAERTAEYREKVLARIVRRTSMKDIEKHIVVEKTITPAQWVSDYDLFLGATFNLGHSINQMLYFRPRNRFEEVGNVYLVGGGTHPGSGLPTIYESARISANLLEQDLK